MVFVPIFSLGIKKSVASQTTVLAAPLETDTIDRCIDEELERITTLTTPLLHVNGTMGSSLSMWEMGEDDVSVCQHCGSLQRAR